MARKSIFKHIFIASGIIAFGLASATPASTQTAQQRACDIRSGASPDEVVSSCSATIQSGQVTGRNLAAAFTTRGRAYRANGEYDRAIADYTDAIRIEPNYVLAFYSRGIAYFNKNDYDRAVADYTMSLRLAPGDILALQNRGHAYEGKQDYERAIADYSEAIRIEPRFAYAFNDRCYARAIAGRELQQALGDCNEALRLIPNDLHTLDSRGFTYLKLGEFDKAITDYNVVLKVNPRQAGSLYGRGLAKQKKGDNAGGDADIMAAKAIRPDIVAEFARYGVSESSARPNGSIQLTKASEEDSVQLVSASPTPGTRVQRGQPFTFNVSVDYTLVSVDRAILSLSVGQVPASERDCSPGGQLTDAVEVPITRGKSRIDLTVTWSGDTGAGTGGRIYRTGYLGFMPMLWVDRNGARGDRIKLFEADANYCYRFGP